MIKLHKSFYGYLMLAWSDEPIEIVDFNGAMAISTEPGPIIITKEQAMKFFDLVERTND